MRRGRDAGTLVMVDACVADVGVAEPYLQSVRAGSQCTLATEEGGLR